MKLITLGNLKSFWKDVKSYVDNGLSKKADSSHGTHVSYGTINGKAPGTPSAGTSSKVAREDHVHPVQTTVSGNAGTATKLQTARTIALGGILSGSASFDGSGNVTITAAANDITTITKTLAPSANWSDTGIAGTNLSTGSYIVQMIVNDGTINSSEYYTGNMSWYDGTCTSSESDEMLLHKAGKASGNNHVYLRVLRVTDGSMKLQIASSTAFSTATSITFKFRKII